MRSSKKRSRSSQNRPRTLGNIINRVFDSSGPEGKVRGTPQQIIEKYQMLARDAQLSNDRVAAENFLQHAEHYTRMLAEATREMAAEQEARQQQYQQQGGGQNGQNGGQTGGQGGNQNGGQPRGERQFDRQNDRQGDRQNDRPNDRPQDRQGERPADRQGERVTDRHNDRQADRQNDRQGEGRDRNERRPEFQRDYRDERDLAGADQPTVPDVIDLETGDDTGLIETPESSSRRRSAPRGDRAPERVAEPVAASEPEPTPDAPKEERTRRPRGPRKPKAEDKSDGEPPQEAAE
jgi:hypothetical protein